MRCGFCPPAEPCEWCEIEKEDIEAAIKQGKEDAAEYHKRIKKMHTSPPFSLAQEARIREIIREELEDE